jgi:hypothetical protein
MPDEVPSADEDLSFPSGADRPPTVEEERLADEIELDPSVAEHYEEMIERGANVKGEGEIV